MFFQLAITVLVLQLALCSPVLDEPADLQNIENKLQFAINYLERYGYLEENNKGNHEEFTVVAAIRKYQEYFSLPVTGLLDITTLNLMLAPRCGLADIINGSNKPRYTTISAWPKRKLTYRVLNGTSDLSLATVNLRLKQSIAKWEKQANITIKLVSSGKTDIRVSFERGDHGDNFPFDGPNGVLAHAFYPPRGDLHFDDDELWVDNQRATGYDFYSVAIHEFGHILGLGHSSDTDAVMYPYYQFWDKAKDVHKDDIAGLKKLYP